MHETIAPSDSPTGLTDLSARLRAERHRDEDDWTRAAVQQWAHGRRLGDFARELAGRGDRVAIEVAHRSFDGAVVAVGDDRLDLRTRSGDVSIRLALSAGHSATLAPIVVRRLVPALRGGVRPPSALVTFRARLLELEATGAQVRVGSMLLDDECRGRITVGCDHVLVHTPAEVAIPVSWVGYVVDDSDRDGAA